MSLVAVVAVVGGCAHVGTDIDRGSRLEQLRPLAEDIRRAVIARDLDALLRLARRDIRSDPTLVDPLRRDLREYLFVTVRDVITRARDLRVRIEDIGRDDQGVRWARLVFFDAATVPESAVARPDFLCDHDLKDAVAWTFQDRGTWEGIGYPFDAFTDIHCSPD